MPTDPTPDPADVELVARALAAEDVHWGYDHGFWITDTTTDPETDAFARAVLRALATEGRLLPAALDGDALLELEPAVPRRVPTQAERIAAARADGHHRITEGRQTATDAMSDRYGETLDLIATAVETATDDTLRGSIRSMIRRVRPEALDLWSAGQVDQAGMKSGMKSRPGSGMDLPRTQTDHCGTTTTEETP